jgi:replicative DNA helicase
MPIYIDDSGTVTVSEIRSRCRRLKSGDGLAAVFIDYLQLVRPSGATRSQNRNDELSEICRTLKATAKDLQIPIIALAQLNRGVESRNDKRPMLSDLRDCLIGDSLIANADTGERVPLADIVERGLRFNVWAMDRDFNLVKRPIVDSWAVGVKPVFRVTTNSGRTIRCTDGHRFRTVAGWHKLSELRVDSIIAVVSHELSGQRSSFARSHELVHANGSGAATASVPTSMDVALELLKFSDVLWDPIASIVPDGEEMVYDITVGDLHNFCVDDFVTHNSGAIEQEADMVTFLYRDAYYNPESAQEPDLTEFIIAKSRNGPTGTVKLRFLKEHTLFVPFGDAGHYSPP